MTMEQRLQAEKSTTVVWGSKGHYCAFESDSMANLHRAISINFEFHGLRKNQRIYINRVSGELYGGVWTNPRKATFNRLTV